MQLSAEWTSRSAVSAQWRPSCSRVVRPCPACGDLSSTEIATMYRLPTYLADELRKLSVADKVYAIVATFGILTILLLVMSLQSVRLQTAYRDQLAASARVALNVERVNKLLYAIVMDSR